MNYKVISNFDCGDKDENGSSKVYKIGDVYSGDLASQLLEQKLIAPMELPKQEMKAKEEKVDVDVEPAPSLKSKISKKLKGE